MRLGAGRKRAYREIARRIDKVHRAGRSEPTHGASPPAPPTFFGGGIFPKPAAIRWSPNDHTCRPIPLSHSSSISRLRGPHVHDVGQKTFCAFRQAAHEQRLDGFSREEGILRVGICRSTEQPQQFLKQFCVIRGGGVDAASGNGVLDFFPAAGCETIRQILVDRLASSTYLRGNVKPGICLLRACHSFTSLS